MPKSRTRDVRASVETRSPVHVVRDTADALFRAARECCRQHDRVSRIFSTSPVAEEVQAAQNACEQCDESLRTLMTTYEQNTANVHPSGEDEGWWHAANTLWLASREYLRRNAGCNVASREFKDHGPDEMEELH